MLRVLSRLADLTGAWVCARFLTKKTKKPPGAPAGQPGARFVSVLWVGAARLGWRFTGRKSARLLADRARPGAGRGDLCLRSGCCALGC